MIDNFFIYESIREIQIFYYASHNHIFINTTLIQLVNQNHIPENIKITRTQISEPNHHVFGQTPFLSVNKVHIVKKQQIWDFLLLILNFEVKYKYQFLSVVNLSEQLASVSNIFSDYDQNPYYTFISPWKKYKRHKELENKKVWSRKNTHFFNLNQETLNNQYFLYKINNLGKLMQQYHKQNAITPQFLAIYQIVIYAMIKHVRIIDQFLYKIVSQIKIFREIEDQVQKKISQRNERVRQNIAQQRPPMRNIAFGNIILDYLKEGQKDKQRKQDINDIYENERQKLYQNIFKPVFVTGLVGIAMWAFK